MLVGRLGRFPTDGEIAAELRVQSRWWVRRRIDAGPKLAAVADPLMSGQGGFDDLDDAFAVDDNNSVFQARRRPGDWQAAVYGAGIPFGAGGPLPSRGSVALAATRVTAPVAREAILKAERHIQWPHGRLPSGKNAIFALRVWVNGELVHVPNSDPTKRGEGFRLRKGVNTMLVECRSENDAPANPGDVVVTFQSAGDGKALEDLVYDVERIED